MQVIKFLVALLLPSIAYTQATDTLLVKLKPENKSIVNVNQPLRKLDDASAFRGYPRQAKPYGFYAYDFQIKQAIYNRLKTGKIDAQRFEQLAKIYRADTTQLSSKTTKQELVVFSGIVGNQKVIICDLNADGDFSNDVQMSYDTTLFQSKNLMAQTPAQSFDYEYAFRRRILNRSALFKIVPFSRTFSFTNPDDRLLTPYFCSMQVMEGAFSIANKRYQVALPTFMTNGSYASPQEVHFGKADEPYHRFSPMIWVGSSFNFDGKHFTFASLSELGDSLKVVVSPEKEGFGRRTGDRILTSLEFEDIYGTQTGPKRKKYTLLDFWGTWCGPCIAGLPQLKAFHETYKDRLSLISVAYDRDPEKVKNFVEKQEMNWQHKFESQTNGTPKDWVKMLEIPCFPTFILVETLTGKILFRDCSEDALSQMKALLEQK